MRSVFLIRRNWVFRNKKAILAKIGMSCAFLTALSCAPIARIPFLLIYDVVSGQATLPTVITPTLLSPGQNNATITDCRLQSGSRNANIFPAELNFSPTNCAISGTPSAYLSPTSFTVQMTNNQGKTTTGQLNLSIASASWANSPAIGSLDSQFSGVAIDSFKNTYAVGYINGNSTFNFGNGVTVQGANGTKQNAVIVKFNPLGVAQWASTPIVAPNASTFAGVAVDSSGNAYTVGYIIGNVQFNFGGSVTATGTIVSPSRNIIIAKYNSAGVVQWARSQTTAAHNTLYSGVAVDSAGNSYAVGEFFSNNLFTLGNGITVTTVGTQFNSVIVKYDSDGLTQWASAPSASPSSNSFSAVAIDTQGGVYAAGSVTTNGIYTFNGVSFSGNNAATNLALVKFNSSGTAQWGISAVVAPHGSSFTGVTVDRAGNVTAVGNAFAGAVNLGNGVVTTTAYATGSNLLIAQFNSATGTAQWAATPATASNASSYNNVSADLNGNLYAVGYLSQNSPYGLGNNITATGRYDGGNNAVVVKYNSSGAAQWAYTPTTASSDSQYTNLALDSEGSVYTSGFIDTNSLFVFAPGVSTSGTYNGYNALMVRYWFGGF
jgi:hypothetical protein